MPTLGQLVADFLRLGALGFGGPVALVGYMRRDLVEQRRWFSRDDYMKGLALSQLAPGPLALLTWRRVPEPVVIAGAALAGLALAALR